jgi:hypothetical protein
MIQDVSTRWNSTSELIGRALYLQPALQMLVIMREHNRARGVRFQRFQLLEAEWDLLAELHPLLDVSLSIQALLYLFLIIMMLSYFLMLRDKFLKTKFRSSTMSSLSLTS